MAPIDRALHRLRYWPGQTLRSRDFRDQAAFDARRRQLHARVLHDGPGVSFGLAVAVKSTGPLVLTVDCGLAYDAAGRELILQRPREVTAPPDAAWLILRRRPDPPASTACCPESDPGCVAEGALDLDQDVELAWRTDETLDPRDGVALARSTGSALDLDVRPRRARPLARPRLARGQTVRGNTPWEQWVIDEPDGSGGLRKKAIGVQTFIDTSAAGFTTTPCYFATLDVPDWDVATSEFAPAFFPQVADPSVDGFTFRLLMAETARRRYRAAFGTARVVEMRRGVGDRLVIDVDDPSPFRKLDALALLRPRGESAFLISGANDAVLTLSAPLPVQEENAVLAVGNLPRLAVVTEVTPQSPVVLVSFALGAGRAPRRNDVLVRLTDKSTTVVDRLVGGRLRVEQPFANWKKEDLIGFALTGSPPGVRSAAVAADGSKMALTMRQATHNLVVGDTVVLLNERKAPLGVSEVTAVAADTVEVEPPLSGALVAELTHAAPVRTDITVDAVQPQNPGIVVKVDRPQVFREGDFVSAAEDTSRITRIDQITGNSLSLEAAIPVKPQSPLVAANWLGAATVDQVSAGGPPNTIALGRSGTVPLPSFVVRKEADGFGDAANVTAASGSSVTLASAITGLARLDTLAIGAFPRVVTVVIQEAPDRVQIVEAGALAAGDVVARVPAAAADPVPLVRVSSVSGPTVVLQGPLAGLDAGDRLGVVHFGDAVTLLERTTPTTIEVEPAVDPRDGDFVAVLTHWADNGNAGIVEDVSGQTVTLGPGLVQGDGIVPARWIDGGIVGHAAVAWGAAFQPWTRLEPNDGLGQPRPATAYGFDLDTGSFRASSVYPYLVDGTTGLVFVYPTDLSGSYRYRPETLAVITTFNADFPGAFAIFSQRQALAVSWFGCQDDFPRPSSCPGVLPAADPCDPPTPAEGS
jgi:hypothetical protein